MNRSLVRRVVSGWMAGLGAAGFVLVAGAAAAEEATETPVATVSSEDSSADTVEAAPQSPTKASSEKAPTGAKSESEAAEAAPAAEATAAKADAADSEVAEISIPGYPPEWQMDGEAYLDDPALVPGMPVPKADQGSAQTPRYKVTETDLTGCVPPAEIPDYCSHRLFVFIEDEPDVVNPGDWVEWWIEVINNGDVGYDEHNLTVTDWVPDNVYFDTFSLEFSDAAPGIDAGDFDCSTEDAAERTRTCTMTSGVLEHFQWVRFLATGQVMWSAEPGDAVANVVEVSSLDSFGRNPTLVEITPIAPTVEEQPVVVTEVANILPVTGSSTMTLFLGGLALVALGLTGLVSAAVSRRKTSAS